MNSRKIVIFIFIISIFTGCASINILTGVKKVPREYSHNYSVKNIIAPKSDIHLEPWIVFSDRDNNFAYSSLESKLKTEKFGFMEPFLVISKKDNYLELIKYKPENIKNNKFTKYKKAEYIGWVHNSQLLLTMMSTRDIRTGLSDKVITVIKDTTLIMHPDRFFVSADSLKIFNGPYLEKQNNVVALHEIFYPMKISNDGKSTLISRVPQVNEDKIANQVIGWIPSITLAEIGNKIFIQHLDTTLQLNRPASMKYSSYLRPYKINDTISFSSGEFIPIIDKSDNSILNVNGKSISYSKAIAIKKNLKKINIAFAIESSKSLKKQYLMLLNAIQNIKTLISSESEFEYQFTMALDIGNSVIKVPLVKDFSKIENTLNNVSLSKITNKMNNWRALTTTLHLLKGEKDATNIVLLIGDEGGNYESTSRRIINGLSSLNCRIIGFQLESKQQNSYNNFVLQVANMIDKSAISHGKSKRSITIFANQVRTENKMIEKGKNIFILDYPKNSMSQGAVVFPEIRNKLAFKLIPEVVDTILIQVRNENKLLSSSIDKAFLTVYTNKDKYDKRVVDILSLGKNKLPKEFSNLYSVKSPMLYSNTQQKISLGEFKTKLMLSKVELNEMVSFFETLSSKDAERKDKSKLSNTKPENIDDYLKELNKLDNLQKDKKSFDLKRNNDKQIAYMSTRKIRKQIQELYLSELHKTAIYPQRNRIYKNYSLTKASGELFGIKSNSPLLENITLRGLRRQKDISNASLELLIEYFKTKKNELIKKSQIEKFSCGENDYYYIDNDLL